MTNWPTSNDIEAMIAALPDGAFERELHVFRLECAKRVLRFLPEPEFSQALQAAERLAINEGPASELQRHLDAASALLNPHVDVPAIRDFAGSAVVDAVPPHRNKAAAWSVASCALQAVACAAGESVPDAQYDLAYNEARNSEERVQCQLLRSNVPNSWEGKEPPSFTA